MDISHIESFWHSFFLLKHHFIFCLLKVGMSHLNKKINKYSSKNERNHETGKKNLHLISDKPKENIEKRIQTSRRRWQVKIGITSVMLQIWLVCSSHQWNKKYLIRKKFKDMPQAPIIGYSHTLTNDPPMKDHKQESDPIHFCWHCSILLVEPNLIDKVWSFRQTEVGLGL